MASHHGTLNAMGMGFCGAADGTRAIRTSPTTLTERSPAGAAIRDAVVSFRVRGGGRGTPGCARRIVERTPVTSDRRPSQGILLLTLACAGGTFALMQATVVPALEHIRADLGTTTAWVAWTVSIYLLAAAVATPLLGRLGDQYGKDRMLLVTLAVFTAGSVASIFAWDIWSLIVFRTFQGVGGAVYPLCFSVIRDEVEPRRQGVAMGLISAMLGAGGGLGLVISGLIIDRASWRWLFVLGALFGLLAIVLVKRYIPPSPHRAPASLDVPGAVMLSAALVMVLVAITEGRQWGWTSPEFIGVLVGGLILLGAWVWVERRTAAPLVDMRMLARRPVLFTNLAGFFCGVAMYATFTVLPLFAQMPHGLPPEAAALVTYGFGATATVAALYLLPGAAAMLPAGPWGGVLGRRFGFRHALALGLVAAAAGAALMAAFNAHPWQLMAFYALAAGGIAIAFGAMPKLIADAVEPTETGIATGMNTVVRTVGSSVGAQVAVTLLAANPIPGTAIPSRHGFVISLWMGAVAALVAGGLALLVRERPHHPVVAARQPPVETS